MDRNISIHNGRIFFKHLNSTDIICFCIFFNVNYFQFCVEHTLYKENKWRLPIMSQRKYKPKQMDTLMSIFTNAQNAFSWALHQVYMSIIQILLAVITTEELSDCIADIATV